jgi:hypothetical protein
VRELNGFSQIGVSQADAILDRSAMREKIAFE